MLNLHVYIGAQKGVAYSDSSASGILRNVKKLTYNNWWYSSKSISYGKIYGIQLGNNIKQFLFIYLLLNILN